MLSTLKEQISDTVHDWRDKIENEKSSGSTSFTIDCIPEFEKLFARNIITILFGEDLADRRLKI